MQKQKPECQVRQQGPLAETTTDLTGNFLPCPAHRSGSFDAGPLGVGPVISELIQERAVLRTLIRPYWPGPQIAPTFHAREGLRARVVIEMMPVITLVHYRDLAEITLSGPD